MEACRPGLGPWVDRSAVTISPHLSESATPRFHEKNWAPSLSVAEGVSVWVSSIAGNFFPVLAASPRKLQHPIMPPIRDACFIDVSLDVSLPHLTSNDSFSFCVVLCASRGV